MALALLSDFPVVRSAEARKLRDAVDGLTGYGHTVVGQPARAESPRGTVNGLRLDALSLVFVAYATPVSVVAPPTRDQVVLVVPLGPMRVETAGRSALFEHPFVLSGVAGTTMIPDPTAGALVGAIAVSDLEAMLHESFGTQQEFSVDLAQARPIPVYAGTALRRVWSDFAMSPDGDTTPLLDRLVIGLAPFTTYRAAGLDPTGTPPAYLTQAVRHIRRHLGEPVSLASLAEVVGIGARQLQLAFQAHLGCTAQEYLRDARLDRAWALLTGTHAGPQQGRTVANVAAEVGIPHTGRFAQYFTERFGVRPSALRA